MFTVFKKKYSDFLSHFVTERGETQRMKRDITKFEADQQKEVKGDKAYMDAVRQLRSDEARKQLLLLKRKIFQDEIDKLLDMAGRVIQLNHKLLGDVKKMALTVDIDALAAEIEVQLTRDIDALAKSKKSKDDRKTPGKLRQENQLKQDADLKPIIKRMAHDLAVDLHKMEAERFNQIIGKFVKETETNIANIVGNESWSMNAQFRFKDFASQIREVRKEVLDERADIKSWKKEKKEWGKTEKRVIEGIASKFVQTQMVSALRADAEQLYVTGELAHHLPEAEPAMRKYFAQQMDEHFRKDEDVMKVIEGTLNDLSTLVTGIMRMIKVTRERISKFLVNQDRKTITYQEVLTLPDDNVVSIDELRRPVGQGGLGLGFKDAQVVEGWYKELLQRIDRRLHDIIGIERLQDSEARHQAA